MAKLLNDKYYTPSNIVEKVMNTIYSLIPETNITDFIESSAGNGAFIEYINNKPFQAFDLLPEHPSITQADFTTLQLPYKQGRLVGFNPPFGTKGNLFISFFKKAIQLGDYVAFILPASQLVSNFKTYEFDLIHSEDLGIQVYSGIEVHCCLKIWKRPANGKLNESPKKKYKYNDVVKVYCVDQRYKNAINEAKNGYDFCFKAWGAPLGKEGFPGEFAFMQHIRIFDKSIKQGLIDFLKIEIPKYEVYARTIPKFKTEELITQYLESINYIRP